MSAFSPDSKQLAVITNGQGSTEPVRLLDPNTMRPTTKLDLPGDKKVWGGWVAFSGDGRYLAATVHTANWTRHWNKGRGYAVVWDLHSPSTPPVQVPTQAPPRGWNSAQTDGFSTRTIRWRRTRWRRAGKCLAARGPHVVPQVDVNDDGNRWQSRTRASWRSW